MDRLLGPEPPSENLSKGKPNALPINFLTLFGPEMWETPKSTEPPGSNTLPSTALLPSAVSPLPTNSVPRIAENGFGRHGKSCPSGSPETAERPVRNKKNHTGSSDHHFPKNAREGKNIDHLTSKCMRFLQGGANSGIPLPKKRSTCPRAAHTEPNYGHTGIFSTPGVRSGYPNRNTPQIPGLRSPKPKTDLRDFQGFPFFRSNFSESTNA